MKIAIRGHESRGKEVIQILKSLGGINTCNYSGNNFGAYYELHGNSIVCMSTKSDNIKYYTLEEFEKEFPFKVGNVVLLKGVNKLYEIVALEWYMNKLCYKLDNGLHFAPETLVTYKEMKKERNITLTLDKAKEWYKKGGELKEIALQAFSEKELKPLPRSWEEFCKQGNPIASWRYNIPTKYEALFKLEQLRDCWRQGWEPIWDYSEKWCIRLWGNELCIGITKNISRFLTFPTKEMADEFLKCFRDLIELARDLI